MSQDTLHPEAAVRVSDGHSWLQRPLLARVRPERYRWGHQEHFASGGDGQIKCPLPTVTFNLAGLTLPSRRHFRRAGEQVFFEEV